MEDDADDGNEKKEEEDEEDLKAPMPLGEIAKINDNITKTKVEGLQTLHTVRLDFLTGHLLHLLKFCRSYMTFREKQMWLRRI